MVKTTVLKVDITCKRCKKRLLKAVSRLEGIDKIEADAAKGTLTVTGNVDPYDVTVQAKKAAGKSIEVLSVGPPPNPNTPKPKPDDGADTNKGKPKPDNNPKDCLPPRSCHSCEREYIIEEYPYVSCSIL